MRNRTCMVAVLVAATRAFGCSGTTDVRDGGSSSEQLIDRYCAGQCGEFSSETECQQGLRDLRNEDISRGCASEFDAVLECMTSREPFCTPETASACSSRSTELENCRRDAAGPDCTTDLHLEPGTIGPATCVRYCKTSDTIYSAECTGASQDGPFDCTCSAGPQTGQTFTAADCAGAIITATDAACTLQR